MLVSEDDDGKVYDLTFVINAACYLRFLREIDNILHRLLTRNQKMKERISPMQLFTGL